MVAQSAADEHLIARLALLTAQAHPLGNNAHTRGVDEHAITVAAVHNLRIARDQAHARLARRFCHRGANALQISHGIALFKDKTAAQIKRAGA